jgi:hypothetical protein
MKDTGLAVRTAYYQALEGNVELNGVTVPVYDGAPSDAEFPYILLSTQDSLEGLGCKASIATDDAILLDIVTGFPGNTGGKKQSDLIANEILQIVHPTITLSDGFQSVSNKLESSITLEEQNGDRKIFRRLLRFRTTIYQV